MRKGLYMARPTECDCGSGKAPFAVMDGYAIFLCYACIKCHATKMRGYRSDIMERYECEEAIEPED